MDRNELSAVRQKIYGYIDGMLFAPAFILIRSIIKEINVWWAVSECDDLEDRCRQMLVFNLGDVEDAGRPAFISSLKTDVLRLADEVAECMLQQHCLGYDYEQMRVGRINGVQLGCEMVENVLRRSAASEVYGDDMEKAFSALFREVWLIERIGKQDVERWREYLCDDGIAESAKMLVVSALTLRLMRFYDARLIELMIGVLDIAAPTLKARLYVCLVFMLGVYPGRIASDSRISSLFAALFDDEDSQENALKAYSCIIRTFKTDEVVRKMHDEIYPDMVKSGMKLRKMMKDQGRDSGFDEGENPLWMSAFDDDKLSDRLRQFSDMQLSGDDVYMGTFAGMKHYPFFSDIAHWFLPFDIRMPDINAIIKQGGDVLAFFAGTVQMCNSDKYSFFYTLGQIPSGNMNEMLSQMGGTDMEQMREEISSDEWKNKMAANMMETEMRSYVQDLFRFYRLYDRKADFVNPFDTVGRIAGNPLWKSYLSVSRLRQICGYVFEVGLWEESRLLFDYLDGQGVWDAVFYQQMGYCAERLSLWADALVAYGKADLINPDDRWTLRHQAVCYRKTGDTVSAIKCYDTILATRADDVPAMLNLAGCYMAQERYDKARALYYKADYLKPGLRKTQRLLAWCLFAENRYDESISLYAKLTEADDASPDDLLNAGHVRWAMNDRNAARTLYRRCRALCADDDKFIALVTDDMEWLCRKAGCTGEDVAVMINQVMMLPC